MLKSVIFDMDGVLINSEPLHFLGFVRTLEQWNKKLTYEEYKGYIGTTNAVINEGLIRQFSLPVTPEKFNEIMRVHRAEIYAEKGYHPIDGVKEMLESLYQAGFTMAVASSSPYENIVRAVGEMGLSSYFEKLVSGENVEHPKPAPDVFLKAARELGRKPEECLVVEDSCHGVHAAKRAGMPSLGFINPDSGDQDLSCATGLTKDFRQVNAGLVQGIYDTWIKGR